MQPIFSFSTDVSKRLIRIMMAGFYAPADVARFRLGLAAALTKLGTGPNQHLMLVDIRKMKVQPQDSVEGFKAFFTDPRFRSHRIAIVVSSSLSRSQVKRAADGRGAEYFLCPSDAEAWLLDEPLQLLTDNEGGHSKNLLDFACHQSKHLTRPAARW